MALPDYYAVLQIDRSAPPEMIDAAYRRMAARFHPDLNRSRGAAERMRVINEAYHVLGDPERRRAYDLLRATPLRPATPAETNAALGKPPPAARAASSAKTPIVCANCGRQSEQTLQGHGAYNCPHCGRRFMTLLGHVQQIQTNVERGFLSSRRVYRLRLALPEGAQVVQFEAPHGESLPLRENERLVLHFDLTRQLVLIQSLSARKLYRMVA